MAAPFRSTQHRNSVTKLGTKTFKSGNSGWKNDSLSMMVGSRLSLHLKQQYQPSLTMRSRVSLQLRDRCCDSKWDWIFDNGDIRGTSTEEKPLLPSFMACYGTKAMSWWRWEIGVWALLSKKQWGRLWRTLKTLWRLTRESLWWWWRSNIQPNVVQGAALLTQSAQGFVCAENKRMSRRAEKAKRLVEKRTIINTKRRMEREERNPNNFLNKAIRSHCRQTLLPVLRV